MDESAPPLDGLNRDSLTPPMRRVLADNAAELLDWRHETLAYTVRNPLAGGVFRIAGHARTRDMVRPWSLVLKVSHAPAGRSWPDGRVAPPGYGANPAHGQYWKREALAYGSGLLDDLPGGVVAPRCFGVDERSDNTLWLWLETVDETAPRPWSLSVYRAAARHLGQFNGAYLAGRPLPDEPWLNRGFLRATTEEPARVARVASLTDAETWAHPLVRATFPVPVADRLRRLHIERERFLGFVERQPQTLCHLDAFPGNLLAREDAAGAPRTVALDWAFVGLAAVGEEVGHLIAWSLLIGAVDVKDAEALRAVVLGGYLEGLRDAAVPNDVVKTASAVAAVAAALRWAFSAAYHAVRPALDASAPPDAERMVQNARLVCFLLDWLDAAVPERGRG